MLRRGSRGPEVRRWQRRLQRLGLYDGNLDGIFGPKTERAVRALQDRRGLSVDGIIGPNTRRGINRALTQRQRRTRKVQRRRRRRRGGRRQAPELPPLSAEDFADLAAQRRAATREFQAAQAEAGRGRSQLKSRLSTQLADIGSQYDLERTEGMRELAGQNLARQPRFAGRMLGELRNAEARARGEAQAETTDRLSQINRMVRDARRQRRSALAGIEAEKVRRRANLRRLMRGR